MLGHVGKTKKSRWGAGTGADLFKRRTPYPTGKPADLPAVADDAPKEVKKKGSKNGHKKRQKKKDPKQT